MKRPMTGVTHDIAREMSNPSPTSSIAIESAIIRLCDAIDPSDKWGDLSDKANCIDTLVRAREVAEKYQLEHLRLESQQSAIDAASELIPQILESMRARREGETRLFLESQQSAIDAASELIPQILESMRARREGETKN